MKSGRIAQRFVNLVALASLGCSGARAPAAGSTAGVEAARTSAVLEPPAQGAFSSGKYRNLFAEIGLPEQQIEQKVREAYRELFHGATEDATVMFEAGQNERGPLAYVRDIGNDDVRSEGMSYGMMIAVQMNEKRDFDALWNWAKTFMQVSKQDHPVRGYFAWKMRVDGTAADEMPAPDGEEYFATALLFAAHRWGKGGTSTITSAKPTS